MSRLTLSDEVGGVTVSLVRRCLSRREGRRRVLRPVLLGVRHGPALLGVRHGPAPGQLKVRGMITLRGAAAPQASGRRPGPPSARDPGAAPGPRGAEQPGTPADRARARRSALRLSVWVGDVNVPSSRERTFLPSFWALTPVGWKKGTFMLERYVHVPACFGRASGHCAWTRCPLAAGASPFPCTRSTPASAQRRCSSAHPGLIQGPSRPSDGSARSSGRRARGAGRSSRPRRRSDAAMTPQRFRSDAVAPAAEAPAT